MDYKRIYDDLIGSRLLMKESRIEKRKQGEYFEAHHILPKSLGGKGHVNTKYVKTFKHPNIVLLTGREHYIVHALLFLIHRNREMAYAFKSMCSIKRNGKRNYVVSSRMYEFTKKEINKLGISPETKEKLRQIKLGTKISPETKEKMRQIKLGTKLSPEHIEKIRQSNLGKKHSPEAKEKIGQANLGKKLSPEHIEKIRQFNLGKKMSPEAKEKMRQAGLSRKHSPEAKEKIRQFQLGRKDRKGKKLSPEHIEKIRQFNLGRKMSPEHIAKAVENRKKNRLLKLAQRYGDIDWSRWEENK